MSTSGDRTVITTERVLPTDGLPDIARSFVGSTAHRSSRCRPGDRRRPTAPRTADLNLHVKGAPMTLKGTVRLSPTASGSVHELDGDLRAGVPLIGGKLEKAAAEPLAARGEDRDGPAPPARGLTEQSTPAG